MDVKKQLQLLLRDLGNEIGLEDLALDEEILVPKN